LQNIATLKSDLIFAIVNAKNTLVAVLILERFIHAEKVYVARLPADAGLRFKLVESALLKRKLREI